MCLRFVVWLVGLVVTGLVMSGCQPVATGGVIGEATSTAAPVAMTLPQTNKPEDDRQLEVVESWMSTSLDPTQDWGGWSLVVAGAGEKLFDIRTEGEVAPRLGESINNIDPTTWEVKLRPDVRFWSGAPVDAAAVRASLERSRRLDPGAAPLLEGVTIEEVDDLTLRFVTTGTDGSFPLTLAHSQLVIHNAASYGDEPDPGSLAKADLTGPYRLTDWAINQSISLEAWPGYWGQQPRIKHVRVKLITDEAARVLAAQSGEAGMVRYLPAEGIAAIKDDPRVTIYADSSSNVSAIYLNLASPILGDELVRQALSWGIDRQELNEVTNQGYGEPMPSWFAGNPGYPEARQQGFTRYNPELAAQLFDQAGWRLGNDGIRTKDGQLLKFRLLTWGIEEAIGPVLQSQWAKLGVQVEVQHSDDYALIQAKRDEGDWDAFIEAWSVFGNPLTLFRSHFAANGDANYAGFNDEQMNEILEAMSKTVDPTELRRLVLAANQRAVETTPIIPLIPRLLITAVRHDVQGFEPHFLSEYAVSPDLYFSEASK